MTRPLRILALNWQDRKHPLAGGAEVHLHEILSRLGAWGHEITLLCSRFEGAPVREEYDNLTIIRSGGRNTFNWTVPRQTRELMHSESFDVVIDDINKIPFYADGFARTPVLGVVHHLFGKAIFREINPIFASYVYLMEARIPRKYQRVPLMVVSESTRDDLISRGMDPGMIRVVHNGIDLEEYRPATLAEKSPDPILAYLGRIKRYKSIDHLLEAVAKLRPDFPTLTLQVLGSGDDEPRLRHVATSLGVSDSVTFTGFVEFETKIKAVQKAWAVVCPSLKEGWGLTNIEANACGTPVVCADVPGLRDSARDGQTGLLYPYGDVDALAERLRRILRDEQLRNTLRDGGLDWASKFSWDRAARDTETILQQVAAGQVRIGEASGKSTVGANHAA